MLLLCLSAVSTGVAADSRVNDGSVDQLSIAYLKAKLAVQPRNEEVRFELARQFIVVGNVVEADRLLTAVPAEKIKDRQSYWQYRLSALWGLLIDKNTSASRKRTAESDIVSLLESLDFNRADYDVSNIAKTVALGLEKPELAVAPLQRLAVLDKKNPLKHYDEAANWALSTNQKDKAIEIYTSAYGHTTDKKLKQVYLMQLVNLFSVNGNKAQAIKSVQNHLQYVDSNNAELAEKLFALTPEREHVGMARWVESYVNLEGNTAVLNKLLPIYLGNQKLEDAKRVANQSLAINPDQVAVRKQLANIYAWTGQSTRSVSEWLTYIENTDDQKSLNYVISLAEQLYEYDAAKKTLRRIIAKRGYNTVIYQRLAEIELTMGYPNESLKLLNECLRKLPKGSLRKKIWQRKIEIAEESRNHKVAIASARDYLSVYPQDTKVRSQLSNLLVNVSEFDQALAELKTVKSESLSYNQDQQNLHIALSKYIKKSDGFLSSISEDDYSAASVSSYLAELSQLDNLSEKALAEHMLNRWHETKDPIYYRAAVKYITEVNDPRLTKKFTHILKANQNSIDKELDGHYDLLADYFSKLKKYDSSVDYFEKALVNKPSDIGLISGLLWSAMQAKNSKKLSEILQRYTETAHKHSSLWSDFGAAYAYLGNYESAVNWYVRDYPYKKEQALWLMDFSSALTGVGKENSAKSMRYKAYNKIKSIRRNESKELPDDMKVSLAYLETEFGGVDKKHQILRQVASPTYRSDKGVAAYTEWLAMRPKDKSIQSFWHKYPRYKPVSPDAQYALLALAVHDTKVLNNHVSALDTAASQAEYIRGLAILGQIDTAFEKAYAFLNNAELSAYGQRQDVIQVLAELKTQYPKYYRAAAHAYSIGDLEVQRLQQTLSWPLGRQVYTLDVGVNRLDGDNLAFDISSADQELTLDASWSMAFGSCMPKLRLGSNMRDDEDLIFFGIDNTCSYNSPLLGNMTYGLVANEVSADYLVLRALGAQHRAYWGIQGQLTPQLEYGLDLGYRRFVARNQDDIGDGYLASVRLGHMLIDGVSDIKAVVESHWSSNTSNDDIVIYELNNQLIPIDSEEFDQTYHTLGFGVQMSRGQVGSDSPQIASPRYTLNAGAEYSFKDEEVYPVVSGELASKVFGRDELGVRANYSEGTGNAANSETLSVSVFYSKFFK